MSQIVGLLSAISQGRFKRDWSNREIAELYRVESVLVQAGLRIETERGITDEGDPWFVFCHSDSSEVIVHLARIDSEYIVAAPALSKVLSGRSLEGIVQEFITDSRVALMGSETTTRDGKVVLHPSALLTVFVATILFMDNPNQSFAAAANTVTELGVISAAAPEKSMPSILADEKLHRGGDMVMFLAAVALAVELARMKDQDKTEVAVLMPEFDASSWALALKKVYGTEARSNEVDLYGVSETYASDHDSGDAYQAATVSPQSVGGKLSEVSRLILTSTEGHIIQLSGDAVEPNTESFLLDHDEALKEMDADSLRGENAPASANVVKVLVSSDSGNDADAASAARVWLDEQAVASGWQLVELDMNSVAEVAQAIEVVDPFLDQLLVFNEAAQHAIERFQASDEDILTVRSEDGRSYIMFDRSDFVDGGTLSLQTWVLEDNVTVTILGHVDTVADAIGLMA